MFSNIWEAASDYFRKPTVDDHIIEIKISINQLKREEKQIMKKMLKAKEELKEAIRKNDSMSTEIKARQVLREYSQYHTIQKVQSMQQMVYTNLQQAKIMGNTQEILKKTLISIHKFCNGRKIHQSLDVIERLSKSIENMDIHFATVDGSLGNESRVSESDVQNLIAKTTNEFLFSEGLEDIGPLNMNEQEEKEEDEKEKKQKELTQRLAAIRSQVYNSDLSDHSCPAPSLNGPCNKVVSEAFQNMDETTRQKYMEYL